MLPDGSLGSGDIGDVGHPRFVGPRRFKALFNQIFSHWQVMPGVRRGDEFATLLTAQIELFAQPANPVATDLIPLRGKLTLYTAVLIATAKLENRPLSMASYCCVRSRSFLRSR